MADGFKWLALGYNVPINPSKNRVYIWRKLKEFGAEYFRQSVAVLPYTKGALAQFKGLCTKIRASGGEASIVEMRFLEETDHRDMVQRFQNQALTDFDELLLDCSRLMEDMRTHREMKDAARGSEQMRRVAKRYSLLQQRDHFKATASSTLEQSMREIYKALGEPPRGTKKKKAK